MRKTVFLSLILLLSFSAGAQAPADIERNYTVDEPGADNGSVGAGRVMNMGLILPGTASDVWTGVFGNITSEYVVGRGDSPFFSWELLDASYVYASTAPLSFESDWQPRGASDMTQQYPFLENSTEAVEETFNTTASLDSRFQADTVDTIAAETYNASGKPYWTTMYLGDGDSGFFAGEVDEGTAFNNRSADYQIILPEDGSSGGGTEYGIYLELE